MINNFKKWILQFHDLSQRLSYFLVNSELLRACARLALHHLSPSPLAFSLSFFSYFCFLGFKSSWAMEFQYDLFSFFFLNFIFPFSLPSCPHLFFLPVVPESRLVFLSLCCLYYFHCWYLKLCPFGFFVSFFVMDKIVALKRQMTRVAKLFHRLFWHYVTVTWECRGTGKRKSPKSLAFKNVFGIYQLCRLLMQETSSIHVFVMWAQQGKSPKSV